MMATDCLIKRTIFSPAVIHHRKRGCYGNPRFGNINKNTPPKEERRFENAVKNNNNNNNCKSSSNLVIGRVRILKRGESPQTTKAVEIDRKARRISADDDVITSRINNRLGSMGDDDDDDGVEIKYMADMYAGSAFSMSPSPRSVPLPSFFNKNSKKTIDDSATVGLRRLLRLE